MTVEALIELIDKQAGPRTLDRNGRPLSGAYNYITNSSKERHHRWVWEKLIWKDAEGYSVSKSLHG